MRALILVLLLTSGCTSLFDGPPYDRIECRHERKRYWHRAPVHYNMVCSIRTTEGGER